MIEAEKIIKRMEELINEDNSFGAYEEYSHMIDETYKEGYNDGIMEAKINIAKKLMKNNTLEDVKKITGLTLTQLKNI